VRVTSPQRGVVVIEALITDPLAGVVLRDTTRPILTTGPADRPVLALLAGVTERGRSWIINLRLIPHWLIVGATRSGKSTLIHALVTRLAPQAVAIVGIDLKGGLELSVYGRRLSGLATTRAEAVKILSAVLEIVFERMEDCRRAAVRAVWELPTPPPPIVILIDEVAELYLVTNSKDREETAQREQVAATLLRLAQLGGALDVHLIVGGQRFGSDLGPGATALRSQLGGRVCMHVNDPETAHMVLGDLFKDAVAVAQMITPDERGTAVTSDGADSWVRAKGTLTSPEEAADVAYVTAKLTPVLPGIDVPWNDGGGEGE
jgi:S-DNA-T family DNA segregation ATPase FtsK/SpoIIIE